MGTMESVTRNVTDMDPADRQALEHVLGQCLSANQQVIINVVNVETVPTTVQPTQGTSPAQLPAWCNVYDALSDAEIADIETSIVRSPSGRTFT
jgi:hypothetical protein